MPAKRMIPGSKSKRFFGQSRKAAKMLRAGLYARVSTVDQQTLPMQMRALREYASKRGWTVVEEVREVGSGAVARALRQRLLDAAILMSCWFGDWTAGGGRWPIWCRRCRN